MTSVGRQGLGVATCAAAEGALGAGVTCAEARCEASRFRRPRMSEENSPLG